MSFKIIHTHHILNDSSRRIVDKKVKTKKDIKAYYNRLFSNMYNGMKFEGQEAKLYWQKKENGHDYGKIVCGKHKFVFKKKDNKNEFILITYMYKTDVDTLEGNLLKTVRYWQGKN